VIENHTLRGTSRFGYTSTAQNARRRGPRCIVPEGTGSRRLLNAQCQHLNEAHSNDQHCECYRIVIEPMPTHDSPSHVQTPNFLSPVMSAEHVNITPPLFHIYFAANHFGFATCGENPANVSQFVAGIRQMTFGAGKAQTAVL